jgi:hypothetical protein
VVSDTSTATPSAVPVACGSFGVTVAIDEACEGPGPPPVPDPPDPEDPWEAAPDGGAGPTALILPGVVVPVARTMETASPTAAGGRFGPSGTETSRVVVVTPKGASPGDAGCPGDTERAPTRTGEGRKTTSPKGICASVVSPVAASHLLTASAVSAPKWSEATENKPDASPSEMRFDSSSPTSGPSLIPAAKLRQAGVEPSIKTTGASSTR